jgi:hypothetical protein
MELKPSLPASAAIALVLALSPIALAGQAATRATPKVDASKLPRTADGRPDLQGIWTNATITPFERPADLGDKAFLTDDEAAAVEQRAAKQRVAADGPPPKGSVGSYNQFWFDAGTTVVSTRQTSLVIDPPDGRVPVTKAAEQKRDETARRNGDGPEYMSMWDRCITRGPGAMFPAGYNNAYQILQMPGHVVIHYEMIHEARIIPMDGRPHAPSTVRTWNGDARGRWEGDTLVVDTTNFNDKGWIGTNAAVGRIKGIGHSEALHIVERFRLLDADTIRYEITIDDPNVYTRPWKVSIPLTRDPAYQIYEYACHEGNHAMEGILKGARLLEREAAQR